MSDRPMYGSPAGPHTLTSRSRHGASSLPDEVGFLPPSRRAYLLALAQKQRCRDDDDGLP